MDKNEILEKLRGGLIVSCQALEDEPLHSSYIMSKMAVAAKMGGAAGIRANSYSDIKAIKKAVDVPVIGIIKKQYENSPVYITPTLKEVSKVVKAGADIVAIDATKSLKPDMKTTSQLIKEIKQSFDILVMADVSIFEEGIEAAQAGADIVSTTLSGYTQYSQHAGKPDFELVACLSKDLRVPVVAEGNIWTPEQAHKAMEAGAFAVVVGTAITRPQLITRKFSEAVLMFKAAKI